MGNPLLTEWQRSSAHRALLGQTRDTWPIPAGHTVDVPTGYAAFPKEIRRPPRSIAEKTYTDIRRWTVMPKGGHFAAMEQPDALAKDVRQFFRPLRSDF